MQISNLKRFLISSIAGVGLFSSAQFSHAFDASEILQSDTSSNKVFEFFFTFRQKGKSEEAFQVLKYAADNGNPAAQWKLAKSYQNGDGVEQDPLQAFSMFQRIADQYSLARPNTPNWQFSADALVQLGNYYKNGIEDTDIQADRNKAQVMYTTAAMVFRHAGAQFELGRMQLYDGKGFGDPRLGIRNLSLAYKKGHVGAEALLGYSIFEGEYIKRNPVRGLIMLCNALSRSNEYDAEWITPLYEEVLSLATPEQRMEANEQHCN